MSKVKTKRNNKILKLRSQGVSYRQIAKIMNISAMTVWEIVNKHNKTP